MDWKVFNDCIHGHMSFPPAVVTIIDTPQVQRLRNIKQLGLGYFVYPSASHNRFEHSLGTCHLAGKLMDALMQNSQKMETDLDFEEEEKNPLMENNAWKKNKLCVQIAGLCHDLGHGPFSHSWEKVLEKLGVKFEHEKASKLLFREILNEKVVDRYHGNEKALDRCDKKEYMTVKELLASSRYNLDEDDFSLIEALISGDKESAKPEQNFLFEIINNEYNGIDVDKWDYLMRDKTLLNIPVGFDHLRLLNFCQVLKGKDNKTHICYRDKEVSNIRNMFLTRAMLHEKAYQHPVVQIVEAMFIDAMCKAAADTNSVLRRTDAKHLEKLTDHIYYSVLHDDGNKEAQRLLQRIEKRELYKIVDDLLLTNENDKKKIQEKLEKRSFEFNIGCILIEIKLKASWKKGIYTYKKTSPELLEECDLDKIPHSSVVKIDMDTLKQHRMLIVYKGDDADVSAKGKAFVNSIVTEFKNGHQHAPQ